jgi:hypothetical protein
MNKMMVLFLAALLFSQCKQEKMTQMNQSSIMESTILAVIDSLKAEYGNESDRIARGVRQVAALWLASDGSQAEFSDYCRDNFVDNAEVREKVFQRISTHLESIFGYFNKISVDLQRPLHLDAGEDLPVDEAFGSYSPATHFEDDFFRNKLAFFIILNFPYYTLEEKNALAPKWSRKDWAYARLGDIFDSRLSAEINQQVVNAVTRADMYIADYNVYAGRLVNGQKEDLFPPDMKLLSHWNIRDEIKSNYGDANGLEKQRILYEVMKRIITQEIPSRVINSPDCTWDPYTNKVFEQGKEIQATAEPCERYATILNFFHAQQNVDASYPSLNTYILRTFQKDMEIPLEELKALFQAYLSSPEAGKVAAVIREKLGRNLEPFDIWYDGFKTRTSIASDVLDKATRQKYPNAAAFQKDLSRMLLSLGFKKDKALSLASKIQVDAARGSGHAWGAETREQKSLLRTRISAKGMDYKGYNIAVHEFGHNVEQTISLHDVDYYLLHGVPNTAFTETLAFLFQKQDLFLLGMTPPAANKESLQSLDMFWSLFEIMGVSLVDIGLWEWMYQNPEATPQQLRDAVVEIARAVWNEYYAPVFGIKDQPILAIYSHMVNAPLYLPNYAYGHIIEFQIGEYLRNRDFGAEVERMYKFGRLTPQQWMQEALGAKILVQPILNAVNAALSVPQN